MRLTYIYHDCFVLETSQAVVVFDYWRDPAGTARGELPGFFASLPVEVPVYVMVSHHHKDHYSRDIFEWDRLRAGIHYILSRDTARSARPYISADSHYAGHKVAAAQVTVLRPGERAVLPGLKVYAYGSTDTGNSWVVESGGLSAMHAGDLNAWIWKDESTEAEVRKALGDYRAVLRAVAADWPRLDVCMFPVDSRIGTDYWTGAALLVRAIEVGVFFPMHFELGESTEEVKQRHRDAADFGAYANQERGEYVMLGNGGCYWCSKGELR